MATHPIAGNTCTKAFDLEYLIATLRTLKVLTSERVAAYALIVLIAYVPMLAKVYIEATGSTGSDFLAFWGAGKIVAAGTPALVYDLPTEHAAQVASGTGQFVVFVNPPPYLFLIAPLGLLPYDWALVAWVTVGWAAWFAVARKVLPRASLAILAFPAAYLAGSHAQNGFFTGALMIGGALALRRSQPLSGVLFGALIIKPHLALLVPFWLAAGRKWTAFMYAAASAMSLCLLSLLVFGLDTWLVYPQIVHIYEVLMAQEPGEFFLRMATVFAALRYHFDPTIALIVQGFLSFATLIIVCRCWARTQDEMAAGAMLLAGTALASPYLFSYDLAFLALPVFWLVADARRTGWLPWEKLIVVGLWLAPLATRAAALPLHVNLMPIAAAVLVWAIWRRVSISPVSQ